MWKFVGFCYAFCKCFVRQRRVMQFTKMNKTNQNFVTKITQGTEVTSPFLLSVLFLLCLCFLMLSDVMWLEIGVTPSGPLKRDGAPAIRLGTLRNQTLRGCTKKKNWLILIWRGTNHFSRFWPLVAAAHVQTKPEGTWFMKWLSGNAEALISTVCRASKMLRTGPQSAERVP